MDEPQAIAQAEPGVSLSMDYLTQAGAAILAEQLRTYWRAADHGAVEVWIFKMPWAAPRPRAQPAYWCVRSNLINGLPP